MRRSWAAGLIIISILTMACGGAASVDDYKAAFVYVGPADDTLFWLFKERYKLW